MGRLIKTQIAPIQSTSITNRQFLAEEMKMYLVERDDYVRYSDGRKLEAKDLSVEQKQFLSQLYCGPYEFVKIRINNS